MVKITKNKDKDIVREAEEYILADAKRMGFGSDLEAYQRHLEKIAGGEISDTKKKTL